MTRWCNLILVCVFLAGLMQARHVRAEEVFHCTEVDAAGFRLTITGFLKAVKFPPQRYTVKILSTTKCVSMNSSTGDSSELTCKVLSSQDDPVTLALCHEASLVNQWIFLTNLDGKMMFNRGQILDLVAEFHELRGDMVVAHGTCAKF